MLALLHSFYFLLADKPLSEFSSFKKTNALMYDVGSSVKTLSPWAILSVTVKCKRELVKTITCDVSKVFGEQVRMCKLVCCLLPFAAD